MPKAFSWNTYFMSSLYVEKCHFTGKSTWDQPRSFVRLLVHEVCPLAHELQEWLFITKMAEEGKVADVEDDLDEEQEKEREEPPPEMIEVVFKTGKFGMKTFKVEADQVCVYTVLSFMPLMMIVWIQLPESLHALRLV